MAGEINFGLLRPPQPVQQPSALNGLASGLMSGYQMARQNALAQQQMKSTETANKLQEYQLGAAQRADDDETATRNALVTQGGDLSKAAEALEQQGLYKQSQAIRATMQAQQKAKAEKATQDATVMKDLATQVIANPTLDSAVAAVATFGELTGTDVRGQLESLKAVGNDPDKIMRWAAGHAMTADKFLPKVENVDMGGTRRTQVLDPITGKLISKTDEAKTATPDAIMTDKRAREEGAANRGVTLRGQNLTDARGRELAEEARKAKFKPGMSATVQKEVIQTDEEIDGGRQALTFIKAAKDMNKAAMGGMGAGAIAKAGTILPDALRPSTVDATIELDNVLQNSALPQLKAIFGGMPTEGERKILLDVQGSSSQPAAVREKIFERAETAVKNRLKFAENKAKALRDGTYFTGESPPPDSKDSAVSGAAAQVKKSTSQQAGPSVDDRLKKYQ